MATIPKRQPAPKFWIADILNAQQKTSEHGFKSYSVRGRDVIRANVTAAVIATYQNEVGNYSTVTLDDGSAQIRLKAWNEDAPMLKLNAGEIVLVVGKINQSDMNSEIFIRPEIVKPASMEWMALRIAELKKQFGAAEPVAAKPEEEVPITREETIEEFDESPKGVSLVIREKVIQAIASSEGKNGIDLLSAIKNSGLKEEEAKAAIDELIREGEAFQPKQGFIKLIS